MLKKIAKSIIPAAVWARMCEVRNRIEHSTTLVQSKKLGIVPIISMKLSKWAASNLSGNRRVLRRLWLPDYNYPLFYRDNTSDLDVIWQVFGEKEYECAVNEDDVSLIVDCGANIGCTSFFFLHRYPKARVVAVEPDRGNFAVCRRNLARFGDRVRLLNAAVWPTKKPLKVLRNGFRDGREWSFRVLPIEGSEAPEISSVTIDEIIRASDRPTIDLLKIDIEGGERYLFQREFEDWLTRTRNLVIELHDNECESAFFHVLNHYNYDLRHSGELTYCRNLVRR